MSTFNSTQPVAIVTEDGDIITTGYITSTNWDGCRSDIEVTTDPGIAPGPEQFKPVRRLPATVGDLTPNHTGQLFTIRHNGATYTGPLTGLKADTDVTDVDAVGMQTRKTYRTWVTLTIGVATLHNLPSNTPINIGDHA